MKGYYKEGREQYKVGNFKNALNNFQNAYSDTPESIDNLYAIGKTLSLIRDYEKSLFYYDKILKIHPTHIKSIVGKSISLANLDNSEEALNLIEDEIKNSNNGYLWAIKGRILSIRHEKNSVINNCFSKAYNLCKDRPFLYYQQAKACLHTLKIKKSIDYYKKSIDYLDDSVCGLDKGHYLTKFLILLEMSNPYCMMEKYELALESVEEALFTNKKSIIGLYSKSCVFYEQRKYNDAKDVLNVLLHMEPDNLDALNLKALIFDLKGYRTSAKNIYKQIHKIDENYKYSLGNMTLIYYNENQYDEALKTAKKALKVDPSDPVALRFGAMASRKLGELFLARKWENELSGINVDSIYREKNLQDKLVNEDWRLRKLGYNLKLIDREFTLTDRPGRLDLLYRDRDTNELVVIELKVVKATVSTYNQITNYMDSISKTRSSGKDVKGIVISYGSDKNFDNLIKKDNNVSYIDYKRLGLN